MPLSPMYIAAKHYIAMLQHQNLPSSNLHELFMHESELQLLMATLDATQHRLKDASTLLGIDQKVLATKLIKFGLEKPIA